MLLLKQEVKFASKLLTGQITGGKDENKVKFTSLLGYNLSNPYEFDLEKLKEFQAELNEVVNQVSILRLYSESIDPLAKEKSAND